MGSSQVVRHRPLEATPKVRILPPQPYEKQNYILFCAFTNQACHEISQSAASIRSFIINKEKQEELNAVKPLPCEYRHYNKTRLAAATAAVSVRKIRGPSDATSAPASFARSISPSVNPPSGPIKIRKDF